MRTYDLLTECAEQGKYQILQLGTYAQGGTLESHRYEFDSLDALFDYVVRSVKQLDTTATAVWTEAKLIHKQLSWMQIGVEDNDETDTHEILFLSLTYTSTEYMTFNATLYLFTPQFEQAQQLKARLRQDPDLVRIVFYDQAPRGSLLGGRSTDVLSPPPSHALTQSTSTAVVKSSVCIIS